MVYLKRYGYKFFPLDGEATNFSFFRGWVLGAGILLSFLFAGLDVPIVYHLMGFAVAAFLFSLLGERWPGMGLATALVLIVSGLTYSARLQFAGFDRTLGVSLVYVYLWFSLVSLVSEYQRARKRQIGPALKVMYAVTLAAALLVGFAPLDKPLAHARVLASCSVDGRGNLSIVHVHALGTSHITLTQASRVSRYHRYSRAQVYLPESGPARLGEVVGLATDSGEGNALLAMELQKGSVRYRKWIGAVSSTCRSKIRAYSGF